MVLTNDPVQTGSTFMFLSNQTLRPEEERWDVFIKAVKSVQLLVLVLVGFWSLQLRRSGPEEGSDPHQLLLISMSSCYNMKPRLTSPPPSLRLPGNQTPPSSSSVEQLMMMMMSPASSEVLVGLWRKHRTCDPSAMEQQNLPVLQGH